MKQKNSVWTLDQALPTIRELQFKALQCGYHLALSGGVLNKGESFNDLDISVLTLDNVPQRKDKFLESAEQYLGPRTLLVAPSVPDTNNNVFRFVMEDGHITDLLFYTRI